jgi:hypothetical protein
MSEQPAMCVGGVDDVHVGPDERPGGRRERRRRELAFVMGVVVVVAVFAGACGGEGEECQKGDEPGGELHRARGLREVAQTRGCL